MQKIILAVLCYTFNCFSANLFSQSVETVTDCNLNGWVKHTLPGTLGTVKFVDGPSNPPLGKGSVQLASPDMSFVRLRNAAYSGTLLSSITELSYSAYVEQRDSTVEMPFIVILADADGDGKSEHNLVFDPRFQTGKYITGGFPDQGITQERVWQSWNALHGGWFLGPADDPDKGFPPFSLATYLLKYPNARINNDASKGGAAIRLTSGGPVFLKNFIGYADEFKIGVNGITTTYDFEGSIAKAGADQKVIYGYGSNCTTLNASAAGGFAPYSFAWSGGGLSSTSQNLQVCPETTTTYTVTVTDAKGCTGVDQVTVFVNDVRCGNKNDKVLVCHKGEEICISPNAVKAHLNHGDFLGACKPSDITKANRKNVRNEVTEPAQFKLSNYPNPFTDVTKFRYELPFDCSVSIKVYDLQGRILATLVSANRKSGIHIVDFSSKSLRNGTFYYKIIATSARKTFLQTNKMVMLH